MNDKKLHKHGMELVLKRKIKFSSHYALPNGEQSFSLLEHSGRLGLHAVHTTHIKASDVLSSFPCVK